MKNSTDIIIDNSKYQVFLMSCPANFPAICISHNWLVTNNKGVISRWESGYMKGLGKKNWGYIRKDPFNGDPFIGVNIFPYNFIKLKWHGKILGYTEGDSKSLAKKMIEFIEESPKKYPYKNIYNLIGPNSNTYPAWILDHFPEFSTPLPKNAMGKNYRTLRNH